VPSSCPHHSREARRFPWFCKGRKRHILTNTGGYLVHALILTADIQDRDGAPLLLAEIIHRFPWAHHLFADGG
jgi:hypothetical protein